MIIVYGNRQCLTCAILKVALADSDLNYRYYHIDEDITVEELEALHPTLTGIPYILDDGIEISLAQLEKLIWK